MIWAIGYSIMGLITIILMMREMYLHDGAASITVKDLPIVSLCFILWPIFIIGGIFGKPEDDLIGFHRRASIPELHIWPRTVGWFGKSLDRFKEINIIKIEKKNE